MQSTQAAVIFSSDIDKYFTAWIIQEDWWKEHRLDDARFYNFVKALDCYEYNGRLDEPMLREKILNAVLQNHEFDEKEAKKYVSQFVSRANDILWFLSHTREFPT